MPVSRTAAALVAITTAVLTLTAATPSPYPVASLPSAAAADPGYPYLWPEQGSRHPRDARPGDTLLISTNDGTALPQDTVRSAAFTEPVTLQGAKTSYAAAATVRCDAKAGIYPVYLLGEQRDSRVWAEVRVAEPDRGGPGCAQPAAYSTETLWPLLRPLEPVRPGGRASIALGVNAGWLVGYTVTSPAFTRPMTLRQSVPHDRRQAQHPTLEQLTRAFTAEVPVRADTRPGLYPVHFAFGDARHDAEREFRFEAQLRVVR